MRRITACDEGCLRELQPPLGEFDDCFSGKIGLSDIDGMVEHNGHILYLEWKASLDVLLPQGQRIAFEAISNKEHQSVLVVWGKPNYSGPMRFELYAFGKVHNDGPITLEGLKQIFKMWFDSAHRSR